MAASLIKKLERELNEEELAAAKATFKNAWRSETRHRKDPLRVFEGDVWRTEAWQWWLIAWLACRRSEVYT